MVYDASLFLPLLLLQFSPPVVVALGAALITVVTPAAIVSEVTALLLLAIPFYSRHAKATPRDSGR
jgi:hypothetical protein